MWDRLSEQIYLNFIKDDRWQYFTNGLEFTLIIAFLRGAARHCPSVWCGSDPLHPREDP